MKKPFTLIAAVIQLLFGALAVAAFFLLRSPGEDASRWMIILVLGIAFALIGLRGLAEYFKKN